LRHLSSINPDIRVTAIQGKLPQSAVIDQIVHADVVIGCTDKQHSRLALSDLAVRYLVPVMDCGVSLEGDKGRITGQVVQLARFLAADACALCRGMIVPARLAQELMTEEERSQRRRAAALAQERGEDPRGYWHNEAQLNTVGYLTTVAGALSAAYAIGWITGRFDSPFGHLQLNISAPLFDVTDALPPPRGDCTCRKARGLADQGEVDALITAPSHWTPAKQLS
jgi:molybdopterin/thiamine biosynthesis adenylyltransferase